MQKLITFIMLIFLSISVYSVPISEKYYDEGEYLNGKSADSIYYSPGYHGILEGGYAIGIGRFELNYLKFNFINGYRPTPYFSIGFGTGIRLTDYRESVLVPVFGDFRFYFTKAATSPFLALGVGYALNASNDWEGAGTHIHGILGANFLLLSNKNAIHIGLGYEKQDLNNRNFNLLSFNLGTSF